MSKSSLTYYIYLYEKNYNTFGGSASRALAAQRNKVQINKISSVSAWEKVLLPLENMFNQVLHGKPTIPEAALSDEVVKEIQAVVENKIAQRSRDIQVIWAAGGTARGKSISGLPHITSTKYMYVDTIARRFKDFEEMIRGWRSQKMITEKQLKKMQRKAIILKYEFKKVANLQDEDFKIGKFKRLKFDEIEGLKDIQDRLNVLFAHAALSKNHVIGQIVDETFLTGIYKIPELAENLVSVKETGSGKSTFKLQHAINNIYDHSHQDFQVNDYVKTDVKTSTNKADITIKVRDLDYVGSTSSIGFSNKNYWTDDLHIVKETPLLDFLQEQNKQFSNHFLNLSVPNRKKLQSTIIDYRQEVKRTLAVAALQGIVSDVENYSAQIMVLNDRKARKTSLVSMDMILRNILYSNGVRDLNNLDKAFTYKPKIESIRFTNRVINREHGLNMTDSFQRVNKILDQARATKLSVSLKKSYVTKHMM